MTASPLSEAAAKHAQAAAAAAAAAVAERRPHMVTVALGDAAKTPAHERRPPPSLPLRQRYTGTAVLE